MRRITRSFLCCLVIMIIVSSSFACNSEKDSRDAITSLEQLNDAQYTIGLPQGSAAMYAGEKYFVNSKKIYCAFVNEGYTALEYDKIDAFVFDKHALDYAEFSNDALAVLPNSKIGDEEIVVASHFGNEQLIAKINEFIAQYKADGTYDDMYERWIRGKSLKMPNIPQPTNPVMTIVAGTEGLNEPMNYYGDNSELLGFDVEFLKRLALALNAKMEIRAMTFDALLSSTAGGKIDLLVANLNNTAAIREQMLVSDSYVSSEIAVLVKRERLVDNIPEYSNFDELVGKRCGVVTGTLCDEFAQQYIGKCEIKYFANITDMVLALCQNKIDFLLGDEPVVHLACTVHDEIVQLDKMLLDDHYGFAFTKNKRGQILQGQFNEYLKEISDSGLLDILKKRCFKADYSAEEINDFSLLEAINGILKVGMFSEQPPFCYVQKDSLVGLETDLLYGFCKKYGYAPEIDRVDFSSLILGVNSKYDMISGCISITEERKESVYFSETFYDGGVAVCARKKYNGAGESVGTLWDSLLLSFEKNFIRENRWKMLLNGIAVTLIISVFAVFLGTILGFVFCFLRSSRFLVLRQLAKIYIQIFQGTPIVVILMILYYLIFTDVEVNGVWVSVVGFALNFAAYSSEMLRTGIEAVDCGQREAAAAIGFSKVQTFIKIVFPQALRYIIPVYKGEVISLVKMTSVVGYIAVQDLTKATDIIRSRTYEAFFPLIMTAIIYFVITYLLTLLLNIALNQTDPHKREKRVKGVENR